MGTTVVGSKVSSRSTGGWRQDQSRWSRLNGVTPVPLLPHGFAPSLRTLERPAPREEPYFVVSPFLLLPVPLPLLFFRVKPPCREVTHRVLGVRDPHRPFELLGLLRLLGLALLPRPVQEQQPVLVWLHHPVLPVVQLLRVLRRLLRHRRPSALLGVLHEVPLLVLRAAQVRLLPVAHREGRAVEERRALARRAVAEVVQPLLALSLLLRSVHHLLVPVARPHPQELPGGVPDRLRLAPVPEDQQEAQQQQVLGEPQEGERQEHEEHRRQGLLEALLRHLPVEQQHPSLREHRAHHVEGARHLQLVRRLVEPQGQLLHEEPQEQLLLEEEARRVVPQAHREVAPGGPDLGGG